MCDTINIPCTYRYNNSLLSASGLAPVSSYGALYPTTTATTAATTERGGTTHHHSGGVCCILCKSKNICSRASTVLPDVERKVMRRVNLCSKHAPPDHILSTITSFDELELALSAFCINSSGVGGSSGGNRMRVCQ